LAKNTFSPELPVTEKNISVAAPESEEVGAEMDIQKK
jgi:hypothetical protein